MLKSYNEQKIIAAETHGDILRTSIQFQFYRPIEEFCE